MNRRPTREEKKGHKSGEQTDLGENLGDCPEPGKRKYGDKEGGVRLNRVKIYEGG